MPEPTKKAPSFSPPAPGARPDVSIITVTFNALAYTRECVKSLRERTQGVNWHLVVVDNGSTDGTVEWLRAQPDITLIENAGNKGYVQANNQGLAAVPADHDVLLLNNDTLVLQDDWLARLRAVANDHPDYGILGCRLINPAGLTCHVGTYMPSDLWRGWQVGSGEEDIGQFRGVKEVEGVVGACLYLRRDARSVLTGLDGDYVSYFEDTDLCFRALQQGFKVVCVRDVVLLHHEHVTTRENQLDFDDIYLASRDIFLKKWESPLRGRARLPVVWHSIVSQPGGYSSSSRNLLLALDERRVDVRYGCLIGAELGEPPTGDPRLDQMRVRSKSTHLPQVLYGQGDLFYKNGGSYRIGYTMLETTGIPRAWTEQANEMDEIWVPSQFNVQTFTESGVTRPIHVVPLGIDPDYYHPGIKSSRFSERYTFLSVFEWGERKNPDVLFKAFARAFGPDDEVALVVKFICNMPFDLRQHMFDLGLPERSPPIVLLQNASIAHYQMSCLYRSADCFVLPTRGEGWGMPILEAMACGLPAIATDWSAQTAFMTPENSYPLRVKKLVPAVARCPYYAGFHWAEADEDHLVELFRHVYTHQEEAAAKGARAAREAAARWTWGHAADHIVKRLEAIGGP